MDTGYEAQVRDRIHTVATDIFDDLEKASKTFGAIQWITEATKKSSGRLVLVSVFVVLLTQGWLALNEISMLGARGNVNQHLPIPIVSIALVCYFAADLVVAFLSDHRVWDLEKANLAIRAASSTARIGLETRSLNAEMETLAQQLKDKNQRQQVLTSSIEDAVMNATIIEDDSRHELRDLSSSIDDVAAQIAMRETLRTQYLGGANEYADLVAQLATKGNRKILDAWTVLPLIAAGVALASAILALLHTVAQTHPG